MLHYSDIVYSSPCCGAGTLSPDPTRQVIPESDPDPTCQVITNPDPTFQIVSNRGSRSFSYRKVSSYGSFSDPAMFFFVCVRFSLVPVFRVKVKMYKIKFTMGKN